MALCQPTVVPGYHQPTLKKTLAQAYLDVSLKLPVEDVKVKQRLDRAYEIIRSPGYEVVPLSTGVYHVQKASTTLLEDTSVQYTVTTESCTCPDFEKARGNMCKHRLAIMMWEDMYKVV